ncbi:MAG: glycosyltransferase family 2 protein [Rhodospirillales bacterium]
MAKKLITVVSPVHNEEGALPVLRRRLADALRPLEDRYDFEFIMVNDGSSDGSLGVLRAWREDDSRVRFITLSRNFGYVSAVMAGVTHAKGDAVIIIESDCQDPPEVLPRFIEEWENTGHDIIYGIRTNRSEFFLMNWLRLLWYRITRFVADGEFVVDMAEFVLLTRRVRDEILKIDTSFMFIRSEIAFAGFKRKGVPYKRELRAVGKSHYNFFKLTELAVAWTLSASTFPLRLAAYLGAALGVFDIAAFTVRRFGGELAGLDTLFLINGLFALYTLIFVSLYAARIYHMSAKRPAFIIDWEHSSPAAAE